MRPDLPPPPSPQWPALTTAELVGRKPDPEHFSQLRRAPISVVLDDVRSLANVGLIFRICDALRVERLYLCGITGYPAELQDFCEAIAFDREPDSGPLLARDTIAIIYGAYLSAERGQRIDLRPHLAPAP